jgi:hypothetical protein
MRLDLCYSFFAAVVFYIGGVFALVGTRYKCFKFIFSSVLISPIFYILPAVGKNLFDSSFEHVHEREHEHEHER